MGEAIMAAELAEALTQESDAVRAEAAVFVDEAVCTRYLCARNHDRKAAVNMLLATTRWRAETRPLEVHCHKCQQDALSHSMRWVGFDTANRPVAYTVFSHAQNRFSPECNRDHCIWLLERMAARLKSVGQPLSKWVWVIDFDGFSVRDNNPLTATKVIRMLQAHHPERLGLVVMYDAPRLFAACWAAIRPLLDPDTAAKVRFEQAGPDAFGFAGEELAAWLRSETAQNRALRDQQPPKKYWLAPEEPGAHDPRGTASWLADTHYIPTYGDQQLERELREKQ